MDDLLLDIFRWESTDEIKDLDHYIASNINEYQSDYIIKIIYNYDNKAETDEFITEDTSVLDKYLETYFSLYFVNDCWNDFFKKFVPKMKDIKMHCPNYLLWIIRVFDDDVLRLFIKGIVTKTYSYYVFESKLKDKTSNDKISSMIFLLSEIITMDDEWVKEYIINCNYKITKPLLNSEYNLLNIITVLPSYQSVNWEQDIYLVNDVYCYMLRKRYYKDKVLDYVSTIIENSQDRTKSMYILTNDGDDKVNQFLINLTSIFLLLWKGGRKLHRSKILEITMFYIYSENCEIKSLIQEDILWPSVKEEISEERFLPDYSFLNKCFFMTMELVYVTLFPLIKIHLRIKKKLIDTQIVLKDMINKWGSYDDIPIIDKAVYDRLRKYETRWVNKKCLIEKVFMGNNIFKEQISLFYEDLFRIGLTYLDNNNMINFKIIPEFFVDSALEFMLFTVLDCSTNVYLPNTMKFISKIITNGNLIKNPYLKFKMIEFLSTSKEIMSYFVNLISDKNKIITSLLDNYITLGDDTVNDGIRNKFILIINWIIKNDRDYNYEYGMVKESILKKFIYKELGILYSIFDNIMNKFAIILDYMGNESMDNYRACCYYKDDIQRLSGYLFATIKNILYSQKIDGIFNITMKNEILGKMINLGNYFILKLFGDKDMPNLVDKAEEYYFDKKLLLQFSLKMYLRYGIYDKFVKMASMETGFYNSESILGLIDYFKSDKIFTNMEMVTVCDVIDNINREIKENEEIMKDIEIPEKFLDPILQTLISDPVVLPEINIIADKNVISKHLLTSDKNPFTRTKLTIEILEEYNEKIDIVEKLEKYKLELKEWKQTILNSKKLNIESEI